MHKSTLLLLAVLVGCSEPDAEVIAEFRERSPTLACDVVDLDALAVTELRATSDSSWAVLDEAQSIARGYNDRMELLWTLDLNTEGPLALPAPAGLSSAGDSLVYIVDRERFVLAELDTREGAGRTFRLDFVPASVTAIPDGDVVVSVLPMGATPRELLHVLDTDTLRPLGVPQRTYADMSVNALGNVLVTEPDGSGGLVAIHQFMAPRAFRVGLDGTVSPLVPPMPDGTAGKRDFVPDPPVTDEALPYIYVGASALSTNRGSGEVYVLTQSGYREGDRSERAIMHLDPSLRYIASYLLDLELNAGHMAYLARRNALVVADDLDRIHLCELPARTRQDPSRVAIPTPHS